MPGLRDAARIIVVPQARNRALSSPNLPMDSALTRSKVVGPGSSRPTLEAEPLAAVQGRLLEQARSGATSNISRNDLRRTADAIWDGPAPLAQESNLLQRVLGEIEQRRARPAVRNLIGAYLIGFGPQRPSIGPLSHWLEATVPAFDWIWSQRARDLSLFNYNAGPIAVARQVLDTGKDIARVLDDCGLASSMSFVDASFQEACKLVPRTAANEMAEKQVRLMNWAQIGTTEGQPDLRFRGLWAPLAEALFCPWSTTEPPEKHKALLIDFAISSAGDPRISVGDPRMKRRLWNEFSQAEAVLRRWLTRASFRQFFEFVDATALGHHWDYRRAFWSSWLDAGHMSNAWVAFGPDAAWLARRNADRSKDPALLEFGKVSGRTSKHSALLMQIGGLTIADWSHVGKYNIWRTGDPGAPLLFKDSYQFYELQSNFMSDSHVSSERLVWQSEVARIIRDETGLRTDASKWRPR